MIAQVTKYAVTDRGVVGFFVQTKYGFRFIPFDQHAVSRKHWPSAEAAMPRWAKGAMIVEANGMDDAAKKYAAHVGTLAGRVCALSTISRMTRQKPKHWPRRRASLARTPTPMTEMAMSDPNIYATRANG